MAKTAGGYPYLSVNAYNPWAMIGSDGHQPLAFGGGWSSDTVPLLGPIPGVLIGTLAARASASRWALARLAWRDDRRSIVLVAIFLALGFFILPTRVHERYMFPIFAFLPLLAVVNRRWLRPTSCCRSPRSSTCTASSRRRSTPRPTSRPCRWASCSASRSASCTSVALNVVGFVFIVWALRPSAADEPDEYELGAADDMRSSTASLTSGDGEPLEPERARAAVVGRPLLARSCPASRSAATGARCSSAKAAAGSDRRDLGCFVVVFVAALFLRTYRLEVPYGMHFDEVYHARTAMEFLQDWRYGMPHSIYEYTHPHLPSTAWPWASRRWATTRSPRPRDLGAPVNRRGHRAALEPTGPADSAHGDRLYVATGTGVRRLRPGAARDRQGRDASPVLT